MSPADLCLIPLFAFGAAFWALVAGGVVWAVRDAFRHRLIHRRLGLEWGYSALCPMCVSDEEIKTLPWAVRLQRNATRKRLRREEFD